MQAERALLDEWYSTSPLPLRGDFDGGSRGDGLSEQIGIIKTIDRCVDSLHTITALQSELKAQV